MIGYWSTVFAAMILIEHFVFRKNDFSRYDLAVFDQSGRLPVGIAALLSFLCAFGMIVPCMSQAWYVGPIADKGTGDIGIIVGSAIVVLVYPVFRTVELAVFKR